MTPQDGRQGKGLSNKGPSNNGPSNKGLSNKGLEALTWVLIYSGLFFIALGVFVRRGGGEGSGGEMLGGVLIAVGVLDAAAGAVLVWLRSRRGD